MSIKLARKNGIKHETYYSRVRKGMDPIEAATKPARYNYTGDFAVYRNDEVIAIGTAEECAEELGVTADYIRWMVTPSGQQRIKSRIDQNRVTTAIKLDEED